MQSRCKKHCRWNERLRFNHITTLRRRMQVSKSFCGNAKRVKINSVLKVCLESRAFSLFQISFRGDLKKSKISSISTNAAGLCVKKPWNPQRIPAALCLKILLVFAKYPSFSLFSDTPPAPSFQSILCKLQPLTRHSVRHLPYNKRVLPCVNLQLIYLKQL